ncbi:hypothetical protein OC846_001051 [Tilletia horrida]|uniref:Phosphoglycerate mutase family protein n=1 Tax=Tilletia horrida TaxID=155126 RepID=A0AAN6GUI3_9BASI|nr:hypothetical protein OC845_000319 [Tilletia horrida]KAK0556606.1 hypothetical protein OC846_001051 [Tilletia horrida]KAK0569877.1 hypothetical protein OC861_000458 [Tilletia horrida]
MRLAVSSFLLLLTAAGSWAPSSVASTSLQSTEYLHQHLSNPQQQQAFALGMPDSHQPEQQASVQPGTIFLIRHAEKRKDGSKGLAPKGKLRAQCLKHVFGRGRYKVDYIMAQAYKPDGKRSRPFKTVEPLANQLGIKVDLHCEREDAKCVAERALNAVSRGHNVLVCWQHKALTDVARALGVRGLRYPPSRSDILFQLSHRGKVHAIRSEECAGLDDDFRGWHGSKRMNPEHKLVDDESWAPGAGEHSETMEAMLGPEEQETADAEAEAFLNELSLDELVEAFTPFSD